MRQVVLDTETTGLEVEQDHRIIEIGCVEIFNRRLTGRSFHQYLNPEREIAKQNPSIERRFIDNLHQKWVPSSRLPGRNTQQLGEFAGQ